MGTHGLRGNLFFQGSSSNLRQCGGGSLWGRSNILFVPSVSSVNYTYASNIYQLEMMCQRVHQCLAATKVQSRLSEGLQGYSEAPQSSPVFLWNFRATVKSSVQSGLSEELQGFSEVPQSSPVFQILFHRLLLSIILENIGN